MLENVLEPETVDFLRGEERLVVLTEIEELEVGPVHILGQDVFPIQFWLSPDCKLNIFRLDLGIGPVLGQNNCPFSDVLQDTQHRILGRRAPFFL